MYGCGGNMICVCYFIFGNCMCRKQRLSEIGNLLGRAIQFIRSLQYVQTKVGLLLITTRSLCYYMFRNVHITFRFLLLPPFPRPRLFHGMIWIAGW